MVTNYPQRLTATATGIDAQTTESLVNRAVSRFGTLDAWLAMR